MLPGVGVGGSSKPKSKPRSKPRSKPKAGGRGTRGYIGATVSKPKAKSSRSSSHHSTPHPSTPRSNPSPRSGGRRSSSARSSTSRRTNYSGGRSAAPRQSAAPRSTPRPTPRPKPTAPDANTYLKSDGTYMSQVAQLRQAYSDYLASQNKDKTTYNNQYALDNKGLAGNKTTSFSDLQDDYAGRGLLQSGTYGKAYSDLQTDYNNRQTALDNGRTSYLNEQAQNLSNFKGDQSTATTSAKQEALRRRAAKYGV